MAAAQWEIRHKQIISFHSQNRRHFVQQYPRHLMTRERLESKLPIDFLTVFVSFSSRDLQFVPGFIP